MRAGVHFISKFPVPLAVIKLSHTFFFLFFGGNLKTQTGEEDIQLECFEHRNAPGRIFDLGLRGNRSELQGAKRRGERIWKVEL